jgi:hypothetical protein
VSVGLRWGVRGGAIAVAAAVLAFVACDDTIEPRPPKGANRPPESALVVQSNTLAPQLYRLSLAWSGSDADGRVIGFRYRWVCLDRGGAGPCPPAGDWEFTTATRDTFTLSVPNPTARYRFELAAVDDDGAVDPTPAAQEFALRNAPPVVSFRPGTLPARTLPAVTFYPQAVDPDSTSDQDDGDGGATVALYRAWLDGSAPVLIDVPAGPDGITLRPADFGGGYGMRTVFVQAVDDGGAVSAAIQHTWEVQTPIPDGILLVDDCRMGGFLEARSDQSYRNALAEAAPGRTVVLDVETIPRVSRPDFDAILSLFDHVVWYTDADTVSSGALAAARAGLDAILGRGGHVLLCSSVAFGTRSGFGADEPRFRDLFGIETVFRGPNGSTNFAMSVEDTVHATVTPGLARFRFLSLGLRAVLDCFGSRQDTATRSLYFYPESTFVRATADTAQPFVNPVQFDVGVRHELSGGARALFVSFPLGLPVNDNMGENEAEIRELLRLAGMVGP